MKEFYKNISPEFFAKSDHSYYEHWNSPGVTPVKKVFNSYKTAFLKKR